MFKGSDGVKFSSRLAEAFPEDTRVFPFESSRVVRSSTSVARMVLVVDMMFMSFASWLRKEDREQGREIDIASSRGLSRRQEQTELKSFVDVE